MKNNMEVLPSPQELLREPIKREEIARLVQQQVAEIMAERDALVFEPFFRSRQVAYELKRLQSVPEQEKFSVSYERYGCMDCKKHTTPHAGNNLCQSCRAKWFGRLTQIIKEGIKGEPAQRARGTARAERLIPENAPRDGVHHTWYADAAVSLEAILRCVPASRENAMTEEELSTKARVLFPNPLLRELLAAGKVKRIKRNGEYHTYRYFLAAGVSAALKEERVRQRLLSGGDK